MKSSETPVNTESYGEKLEYDPEFRGPVKSRSCTDIICLFLFIAFLAGWGVVAFFAFREGDPRILLYPTDSQGNICGIGALENKKHLFYFDLLKCASPSVLLRGCPTPQVCVERCPNETFYASPTNFNMNEDELKNKLICKYNVTKIGKKVGSLLEDEDCAKMYFKSTSVSENIMEDMPYGSRFRNIFVNRCIPEIFLKNVPDGSKTVKDKDNNDIVLDNNQKVTVDQVKNATGTLAKFLSVREVGEKMFTDFKRSWEYILLGLVISMVVSLVWIILIRWIAAPMIWLSIIIVILFTGFACYYSTTKYLELREVPGADKFRITLDLKSYLAKKNTWLAFAIISGVVCAVLLLVILFLRKRILIAIAVIKEASKAVGSMVSSLFFPIITYFFMLIFFAFWVVVALYIASSGKASFVVADAPENSNFKNGSSCKPNDFNVTKEGIKCLFLTYGLKENIYSAHAYNLFGLFWGLFFAVGIGQVSLSGAFATYYWTLDKRRIPTFAVAVAFCRCMRYHLGSVAFGSLLIATVRFIRVMLEYVDQKFKKYDNKFTKCLMWCLRCCFWCLETLLKFISKNAYIMIAIYGKNFCVSAKHAFTLLMRNIVRVVVIDKVTDFLLFFGKLVVVAFSASASFYLFATDQKVYKHLPELNYNLLPPIFITIGSYLIASGFFSVYGMAVDTLFLCFLEDVERNDGSPERPYYMSKQLMKLLDKRNKFKEPSSSSP